MRTRELSRLQAQLAGLTPHQRDQLLAWLQTQTAWDVVMAVLHQRRSSRACPRCQGAHMVRNGQAQGLQRFKCRGCDSTFNGLTGAPLAGLRHRKKWLDQAQVLEDGLSVRKAAACLGVHRTTAFRWRHRFLTVPYARGT